VSIHVRCRVPTLLSIGGLIGLGGGRGPGVGTCTRAGKWEAAPLPEPIESGPAVLSGYR